MAARVRDELLLGNDVFQFVGQVAVAAGSDCFVDNPLECTCGSVVPFDVACKAFWGQVPSLLAERVRVAFLGPVAVSAGHNEA